MKKKIIVQLCGLNLGLCFGNVILFSKGLLGFSVSSENPIIAAASITIIIMSILIFCYGNYSLLKSPPVNYSFCVEELEQPQEFIEALESCRDKTALIMQIDSAIHQIQRLERQRETLNGVLFQKFKEVQGDLYGFEQVVEETKEHLYENIKRMLLRLIIFDQMEYDKLRVQNLEEMALKARYQMYAEHISYVKAIISRNEAILLEFDRLLTEASKMGDENIEEDGLSKMQDIICAMQRLYSKEDEMSQLVSKYEK